MNRVRVVCLGLVTALMATFAPGAVMAGAPPQDTVTITRAGNLATVRHVSHPFVTGNTVRIDGAEQNEYNGRFEITVTGDDEYVFTVVGAPATPATGTITVQAARRGFFVWLDNNGFALRKTFDGSQAEAQPASFTYSNPDVGDPFWLVDLAAKLSEYDKTLDNLGPGVLVSLYPTIEWHRSRDGDTTSNNVSGALTAEFAIGGTSAEPEETPWFGYLVILKGKVLHDVIDSVTSGSGSLLFGLKGNNDVVDEDENVRNTWLPMSDIMATRNDHRYRVFRYYPYVGVEYFDNLPVKKGGVVQVPAVEMKTVLFRIQVELYPGNFWGHDGLELISAYEYRRPWDESEDIGDDLSLVTLGVNYYVSRGPDVALGFDIESGRNPKNNFDDRVTSSFGLKIKF